MAYRTIYVTMRIDLENPNVDEITDEEVETFVENCMYDFPSTKETKVLDTCWEHTEY